MLTWQQVLRFSKVLKKLCCISSVRAVLFLIKFGLKIAVFKCDDADTA